ncbi:MAG: tetratricopeptide repeat protein [Spirochaetales bacterium]|nr:tetratricopeptide repeat protein [Spirochaetales bacterium]
MKNTGFTNNTHRRRQRALAISAAFLVLLVLVVYSAYRGASLFQQRDRNTREAVSLLSLWEDGHYARVAQEAQRRLEESPLDRDALLFAGYARFFLAISRVSVEERNDDLDASIRYLRLLKVRGDTPHPERVDYILGKAYLTRGVFWADLAVQYLEASREAGYKAQDLYEYLGRAHSAAGNVNEAMGWYLAAAEEHPTDRLLLTLGEEAFRLGQYDDAAKFYIRAIKETQDESLEKRGLSQLGQLYYDVGNYSMARQTLSRLVDMEPGNENYWFLLGESYFALGENREARRAWFATTRINPRHVGALRRLYD